MYMIIDIELKRSNFSKVKELQSDFEKILAVSKTIKLSNQKDLWSYSN